MDQRPLLERVWVGYFLSHRILKIPSSINKPVSGSKIVGKPLKLFTANVNLVHQSPKPRAPKLFLRSQSRQMIKRMALKKLQEVAV